MLRALPFVSFCALAGCGAPIDSTSTVADAGASDAADARSEARFASKVVSFRRGEGGGFNEEKLPGVVLGAPRGGGCCAGSTDVLSLGHGGEIVLAFDVDIVDRPGPDFIVFENAFEIGGDPNNVLAEPGEVSVSEDGVTWSTFPCTAKTFPYGSCAGWRPAHASPEAPVDPKDPAKAGGDPFDLASIGVKRAKFVRIRDMNARIPSIAATAGFDLDAIAVLSFE